MMLGLEIILSWTMYLWNKTWSFKVFKPIFWHSWCKLQHTKILQMDSGLPVSIIAYWLGWWRRSDIVNSCGRFTLSCSRSLKLPRQEYTWWYLQHTAWAVCKQNDISAGIRELIRIFTMMWYCVSQCVSGTKGPCTLVSFYSL